MKRVCLTCKNKGCVALCRFVPKPDATPKTIQLETRNK